MKQPTENQACWLAALRSGEYKQGQTYLHNKDGSMCCLGVAAKLFKPEELKPVAGDHCWYYGARASCAPTYAIEALGLHNGFGETVNHNESLVSLNDGGKTFAEIADIFEQNLEDYTKGASE